MKMKIVILMIMAVTLSSCGATSEIVELEEAYKKEIEALESSLAKVESELVLLEDQKDVLEEAALDQGKQIEGIIADNMDLEEEVITLSAALLEATEATNGPPSVVATAELIVDLMEAEDFVGLAAYVHPTLGVRFTPYPYIDLSNDLVMTSVQVANFPTDTTVYTWGNYDGSGDVMLLTPMDYYTSYIYDEDYANPETMMWNAPIGTGNMINNISTVYTSADYVEFHFSGFDPQYSGMDWSSLTLVFEQSGSNWYLVGIIHGQWTI